MLAALNWNGGLCDQHVRMTMMDDESTNWRQATTGCRMTREYGTNARPLLCLLQTPAGLHSIQLTMRLIQLRCQCNVTRLKHFEVRCQIVIIKYRPSLLFLIGQPHQLFPLCQTYIVYRPSESGYSQFKQWFRQGCLLRSQILRPLLLKPVVKGIVLIVFAGVFVVSIISILGTFVFF